MLNITIDRENWRQAFIVKVWLVNIRSVSSSLPELDSPVVWVSRRTLGRFPAACCSPGPAVDRNLPARFALFPGGRTSSGTRTAETIHAEPDCGEFCYRSDSELLVLFRFRSVSSSGHKVPNEVHLCWVHLDRCVALTGSGRFWYRSSCCDVIKQI